MAARSTTTTTTAMNDLFEHGCIFDAGGRDSRQCPRNMLRQPGIAQLDMGIFKNFKLTERFS